MRARAKPAVERRHELLDSALALFGEHGYAGTSVAQIIEAAGVSKGGFYHHFPSKDALLQSLVERLAEATAEALHTLSDDQSLTVIDKLRGFFVGSERHKREALGDGGLATLGLTLYAPENLSLLAGLERASLQRSHPFLVTILEQGVAEGALAVVDPPGTARDILLLGQAVVRDAMREDPRTVPARLTRYRRAVERLVGLPEGSLEG